VKARNPAAPPVPRAGGAEPWSRSAALFVTLLTLAAAALRLLRLDQVPPGLNQDEALGAWIANCLLHTGRDMTGQAWPIFYSHGIGDNPSTLTFYTLIPFQAIGGLGVWTTRLPGALSGILCVPLAWFVAARMFGRNAGVVAGTLMAINPWSVEISRFGVWANQCPMYVLLAFALMLRARLPVADSIEGKPRWSWALLAGVVAGLSCYGFHPMKLFFPALLLLLPLLNFRGWRACVSTRAGRSAALALALGFGLLFGPMAWLQVVDPAMGSRWQMTRLWDPGTALPEILRRLLERYALHFGPAFLFARGDSNNMAGPPGFGAFEWSMLPLMLVGLFVAIRNIRSSASNATLLALVLAYPAGDVVARYEGVHPFRSAPGIAALVMLAAWGTVSGVRLLARRGRALAWTAAALFATATMVSQARFYAEYFGAWRTRPTTYHYFHTDLLEACGWLRPRLKSGDRVFWTVSQMNMPFAITLVGLGYDPRRWLADVKDVRTAGGWDWYVRYGDQYFLYGQLCRPYTDALKANGRPDHVWLVVRPHELGLDHPVHVVRDPDGKESLWICEGNL